MLVYSVLRSRQADPRIEQDREPRQGRRDAERPSRQDRAGEPVGPAVENTTLDDLLAMVEDDYKANRRETAWIACNRPASGYGVFRRRLQRARASKRIASRPTQRNGLSDRCASRPRSTMSRRFCAARFRLGSQGGESRRCGPKSQCSTSRTRGQGFFERDQFEAVIAKLPEYMRPLFRVAYITGWRVISELMTRQWRHVDFKSGWLRLEPGEAKKR